MNRKIFVVRHTETDWNANHTYQGWSDNPISELGRTQAKMLQGRLSNEQIKRIFSSPLKRTRQTAEVISNKETKITFVDELKDRIISPEFEGKSEEELFKMTKDFAKSIEDLDYKPAGGESIREVYERTVLWFQKVRRKVTDNFLIVSHEINIQSIIFHLLGLKLDPQNTQAFKNNLRIKHGRVTIVEEDKDVGFYLAVNSF